MVADEPAAGDGEKAYDDYSLVTQGAIYVAQQMWASMQAGTATNTNPGVAAYDKTYEDLQTALTNGQPASVDLNSSTTSSDISDTWAKVSASGLFEDFFASGDGSYEQYSMDIMNAGVAISAKFDRLVSFTAGPLYQPSQDPILSSYGPWFNSEALNIAYKNSSNTVWQPSSEPTWQSTFGPKGNMLRYASTLCVVNGIAVTMTSKAGIAKGDQVQVRAAIEGGFFPFFEANGSGGWVHTTSFDDEGNITVSSKCPQGNPVMLGVDVTSITGLFGDTN